MACIAQSQVSELCRLLEGEERDENDVRFDRLYFLSPVHDRVYRLVYDVTRQRWASQVIFDLT